MGTDFTEQMFTTTNMWKVLTVSTVLCLSLVSTTPVPLGEFDVRKYFALFNDIKIDSSLSPRVIGGDEVIPHSYPSQTALYVFRENSVRFCGGSLISKDWVLTAASCLAVQPDFILVVIGDHNLTELDPPVMVLDSKTYVYHSDYDEDTLKNDVGLVKLPMEVTFTDNIQPAVLANVSESYDSDRGTIVGWGTETELLSLVLREVEVTVISNEECAEASDEYKEVIQPMHVCTSGEGTVGSCNADSGGPLFVDGVQVGIAPFVSKDCLQGLPSVFTRVNDYYDWIMDQIKDSVSVSDS